MLARGCKCSSTTAMTQEPRMGGSGVRGGRWCLDHNASP